MLETIVEMLDARLRVDDCGLAAADPRRVDTARRRAHVLGLVRSRGYRCRLRERRYNASDMKAASK